MRVVVIGDLHFIAPDTERQERRRDRTMFADAYPTFDRLAKRINEAAPDLIISLGDLVDWYSDKNRDFALEQLSQLRAPWVATPGNQRWIRRSLGNTSFRRMRTGAWTNMCRVERHGFMQST